MTHKFLLELGLEEMPAHVVTPSIDQLEKRVADFLNENRLTFGSIEKYSTPRRLTLIINELSDKQDDIDELAKGPAKKIAQDAEGNWSKAAMGFARGQGSDVSDIFFQELKGTEYAYIKKHELGKSAAEILKNINEPIEAMVFPTRMHWAYTKFEYIRPIHWLIAMIDDQVINTQILDIKSGNITRGHRFLGHDNITINSVNEYVSTLKNDYVYVDAAERKNIIKSQIEALATQNNWNVDIDESLLEEVNNLVEYPTAFYGKFNEKYLNIPDEVLITSMKTNQRYFYARTLDGKLAPIFIGVRNGNSEHIENVITGNEKVLVARLEDAQFFFEEDQKNNIEHYVEKLKNVTFQVKIGTMYEKMQRAAIIANILGKKLSFSNEQLAELERAASIYKFDLVTNMIGEFSELQGVMGEKYAEIMGENSAVATSIREHYMPTTAEGELPKTDIGSVLAIADKLDSIMSFFAVDIIPKGSNDPFALRRQAYGIIRILNDKKWSFSLDELQEEVIIDLKEKLNTKFDFLKHKQDVNQFLLERLRQLFKNQKIDHDVIETVLSSTTVNPITIIDSASELSNTRNNEGFKEMVESLVRISKLTNKNESSDLEIQPELFQNKSESDLYEATIDVESKLQNNSSVSEIFKELKALSPMIVNYFDENMIMDKDINIQHNRLAQLKKINDFANIVGDLNELVIK